MTAHYSAHDLRAALQKLPLNHNDVLFLHSNLGFFGRAEGVNDSNALCELFFEALMQRLDGHGTLVVPTFTYAFPRRQIFDPVTSTSHMGVFSEWVRQHNAAHRSCDPCYSVAAIGPKAEWLTQDAPENSFSSDSFFGRFLATNGVILNLNFDAGSTFLHFLEREMHVPYRFDKTFEGRILENGTHRFAKNTIFVRYTSSPLTAPAFEPFHQLAVETGFFHTQSLGRGQLGAIRATDCQRLLANTLPQRPWLLTQAEIEGSTPVLTPEATYQAL